MPVLTGVVSSEGVLVDVQIGWSAASGRTLRAALRPVPPLVEAKALIDTGADSSCVDPTILQALGLPVGGFAMINVPAHGGLTFATQHDASLSVLHTSGDARMNWVLDSVLVVELAIGVLGYQMLLGRDVLAGCRFLFDGPANKFELSY
jgi:hypothetical protein